MMDIPEMMENQEKMENQETVDKMVTMAHKDHQGIRETMAQ